MFEKGTKAYVTLSKLNTPAKIQDFLDHLPFNEEREGETCMSASRALTARKAHCMEGAFLACACLSLLGEKPLIVSLKVERSDVDHIIIPFRRNGFYGAMSKTNHPVLRYRDPVYRSLRELVMSYFHEYFLYSNGKKTLIGYTKPINLNRFGKRWLHAEEELWDIAEKIYDHTVIPTVPAENKRYLRNATTFERKALGQKEWGN